MTSRLHATADDLRGASRLIAEATLGITDVVEAMHRKISPVSAFSASSASGRTGGITGLAYRSVRALTRVLGASAESTLAVLSPALAKLPTPRARDAVVAALNGVAGDHLADTKNTLATPMQFRVAAGALIAKRPAIAQSLPHATGKIVVFVHGLCMNESAWARATAPDAPLDPSTCDFGEQLARDHGFTPIYLRYNTGRHVSENGLEFAAAMKDLIAAWPLPVETLIIVAHSMGGLVSRSAVHHARRARQAWCKSLDAMVFLGTPHLGAPLERGGHWLELVLGALPYASPLAKLSQVRSNGINDLRHGSLLNEDWDATRDAPRTASEHRAVALPSGVRCYAIAATIQESGNAPFDWIGIGDGLVPLTSALGQDATGVRSLHFPPRNCAVVRSRNHMSLLNDSAVYALLEGFITE